MLRGPADADAFRVQVGRYRDRWYHDPLPGCAVAPACTDAWPSVSIVKKAWPKFLDNWIAGEAARCAVEDADIWRRMQPDAAQAYIAKASERTRDRAAGRGSAVHRILEDLSEGKQPNAIDVAAVPDYVDACKALIDDLQPEWLFTEAVLINREHGWGGTGDTGWRIDGTNYAVDFKSRSAGKHGAYDDEGAQLGAYAGADYLVVEEQGRAVRRPLPHLDAGLIISICPDGYRLHPVDLDVARPLFIELRRFWEAMRTSPVGKPVLLGRQAIKVSVGEAAQLVPAPVEEAPRTSGPAPAEPTSTAGAPAPPAVDRASLEQRARAVIAAEGGAALLAAAIGRRGLPRLNDTPDERLGEWDQALWEVEGALGLPFPEPPEPPKRTFADIRQEAQAMLARPADPFNGLPGCEVVPPSDPAIVDIIERGKRLPADLLARLDVETVGNGTPNLLSGKATRAQVELAGAALAYLEGEWLARRERVDVLLEGFEFDERVAIIAECLAIYEGEATAEAMTAADVERLEVLVTALDRLLVAFTYENERPELTVMPKAETAVVAAHGSKSAALARAKDVAESLGAGRPRSIGVALQQPLLAAYLSEPPPPTAA